MGTSAAFDWEQKSGHGPVCCETFVEQGCFSGVCYEAANWQFAGVTKRSQTAN